MFDWSTGKVGYRMAIFPDDSPAIDFVLNEAVVKKIYGAWDEGVHGNLVDYGGGVRAITAKMLVEAGEEFLVGIKGIGKIKALEIVGQAGAATEESPYASGV